MTDLLKHFTWRRLGVFALVALGALSGYATTLIRGEPVLSSCAANMAILDQKRTCGFVDLGPATATGTVTRLKSHNDGDRSIVITPDPASEHLLEYQGRRNKDTIKAEFTPCDQYPDVEDVLDSLEVGDRVRIWGRWAFDGVDHRGKWDEQVVKCIDGREADPALGWVEIHPAQGVERL